MSESVLNDLKRLTNAEILINEPMKMHTTFKVGGNADYYTVPKSVDELISVIKACDTCGVPYIVLGGGANVLISDDGIRGMVIQTADGLTNYQVNGETIIAESGLSVIKCAKIAYDAGLTGMEFASGIPGTLGGAVVMNAGAYDGEMSFIVDKTTYLTKLGEIKILRGEEHQFSYRHSFFSVQEAIVLSVELKLKTYDKNEILNKMKDLNGRRREKQPLEYPSAGSTFKRPPGYFAAKLIEDAGLKGAQVGDAMVSVKHAGFVVNAGEATAADVFQLIQKIQQTVHEKFGVRLETEVKKIGCFNID